MFINDRNFDVQKAMQDIALAYATLDFKKQPHEKFSNPQADISFILETYFQALGYLSTFNEEYLNSLMKHGAGIE